MNLKINAIVGIVCLLIGAYLGNKFRNQDKPLDAPQIAQNQSQKCKAVSNKVTAKDGTVTESVTFEAIAEQNQKITPDKDSSFGISGALFKDKQLNLGYRIGEFKILKFKVETEIVGKLEKMDDLSSKKDVGLGFRF